MIEREPLARVDYVEIVDWEILQPVEKLEKLVTDIETELQNSMQREVTSEAIGELALAALREVDEVAYVRFASVYRRFKDIDSFLEELEKLRDSHEN